MYSSVPFSYPAGNAAASLKFEINKIQMMNWMMVSLKQHPLNQAENLAYEAT